MCNLHQAACRQKCWWVRWNPSRDTEYYWLIYKSIVQPVLNRWRILTWVQQVVLYDHISSSFLHVDFYIICIHEYSCPLTADESLQVSGLYKILIVYNSAWLSINSWESYSKNQPQCLMRLSTTSSSSLSVFTSFLASVCFCLHPCFPYVCFSMVQTYGISVFISMLPSIPLLLPSSLTHTRTHIYK